MSSLLIQVALVSESETLAFGELLSVSAALQKQVSRDFAPIWELHATIDPFERLEDVPTGYWPVVVVDQLHTGDLGIHGQRDGQPIALVQFGQDWSLTASHECLEMLADPWARHLVAGDALDGSGHRVEYLVEVSDPCQAAVFGYRVNGHLVSNFYTPEYFSPSGSTAARYDFRGEMSQPRQVLEGGYLSWRDPLTNHLHRADRIGGDLWFSDLGEVAMGAISLRSQIDSQPKPRGRKRKLRPGPNQPVRRIRVDDQTQAAQARSARLALQFQSFRKR
jgi:hypothetical protein